MSEQGPNIRDYGLYLTERIKSFGEVKVDYVKAKNDPTGQGRLRKLSVEKGLLRETESVQKIIEPLLTCKFLEREVDNEVTLTAFRLLVADLLVLFQVANEGVINILEHYFEMSKPDAERALKIYKKFVEQTDGVIVFMSLARSLESVTRLTIPNLQHAPTSLGDSLEEYVRDPDFEQNRTQFLASRGNKGANGSSTSKPAKSSTTQASTQLKSALKQNSDSSNPFGPPQLPLQVQSAGNSDLIDFFGSLEQPQQQLVPQVQQQNPYLAAQMAPAQMTGGYQQPIQQPFMPVQSTGYNPYQQQQPQMQQPQMQQFTGQAQQMQPNNGFQSHAQPQQVQNEFALLSQPQQNTLQAQTTGANPFRKSMMPVMTGSLTSPYTSNSAGAAGVSQLSMQRTGGNPFSKPLQQGWTGQQQTMPSTAIPMQPQSTGNPFSKPSGGMAYGQSQQQPAYMQQQMMSSSTGSIMPQQTGSNPFRKSMMLMQQPQMNYGAR